MLDVMVTFFFFDAQSYCRKESWREQMKKKRLNYFLDDDRYMIKSREGQKNSFFVPMGGREGGNASSFQ